GPARELGRGIRRQPGPLLRSDAIPQGRRHSRTLDLLNVTEVRHRRHAPLYVWGTSSQGGSMHMHRATKPIVLAVSVVFGLGMATAAAANSHGKAVSDLARASTALVGEARGDAVSALAKTNGRSDRTKPAATERDGQGDAVSAIARSEATAAHSTGDRKSVV